MNELEKLLSVAIQEEGYLEKKSNAQLDDKTANAGSGNYTKYARDFDTKYTNFYNGKKNGYDWCDMFVDWCFVTAFGVERALELLCQPTKSCGAGVGYSCDYYKNKGQFYTKPQRGDQIFFKNSSGIRTHTGLVYQVDATYVYTIEGNTGDGVRRKKYAINSSSIYGYGRPKYKIEEPQPISSKSVDELAKEVIAGKWGSGQDRKDRLTAAGYDYSAVQNKVNEILGPQSSKKSVDEVAKEVLAGQWGNGDERKTRLTNAGYDYSEIQARVNQLVKGNNEWTAREYTVLKAKYVRKSPKVASNKMRYASLNETMQNICIKDAVGYAKFKVGAKVSISKFQKDAKGNLWGMRKGVNTDTWLCVQDSTGKQVK